MVPLSILLLMAGGLVVGAFLKLFSDNRAFRRELREVHEQLDSVLDLLGTLALNPADSIRLESAQRKLRATREQHED